MDGFEKRRQQKKSSILNAALELFKKHGYSKVSIAEIAAKASVSQVSIYNFFQNKENLKKELLKKLIDEHCQNTLNILENDKPIDEKLRDFIIKQIDFFKENSFNFMLESVKENLLNRKECLCRETVEKIDRLLINLFEEGKKQGVLRENVSTQAMYTFFDIFRYYFMNNQEAVVNYNQNQLLFGEILSLFLYALKK